MGKHTLVLGASENPSRYSNMAINRLVDHHHPVSAVGLRAGNVGDVKIQQGTPDIKDLDTITMYMRASLQEPLHEYILSLQPKRIIFNPGAENPELVRLASAKGIETIEACTLVMLSTGLY